MPAFINWPGNLDPGVMDAPTHVGDWLPTIAHVVGFDNELRPDLDGRNIWPKLVGDRAVDESRQMYWKTRESYAVRDGDWKMIVGRSDDNIELYDLKNDFRETQDISQVHSDRVTQMMELLNAFKKDDREEDSDPI